MLFIFDMGGVVTSTAMVESRLCGILGISVDDFMKFCGCGENADFYGTPARKVVYNSDSCDLLSMCSNGFISSGEFWEIFSRRSGIAVKTDWFRWLFHPVLNEDVRDIVLALRKCGYRVVCGTNTIDSHYSNHVERGDYAFFDQTYASCAMGVSKPDCEFWKMIMTAENVLPDSCFFVDDKEVNCNAAESLGIKSHLFKDSVSLRLALKEWL